MPNLGKKNSLSISALQSYSDRLVDGNLSNSELLEVASDLSDDDQLYLRISILAKSEDARFVQILEKYVEHTEDTDVAGVALRALILSHNRTEFLPLLLTYIEGVTWDILEGLKIRSIFIAEAYLKENKDKNILCALIRQFETSSNPIVREAAHEAIMSAANVDRRDVSIDITIRGLTASDVRMDVIERMRITAGCK